MQKGTKNLCLGFVPKYCQIIVIMTMLCKKVTLNILKKLIKTTMITDC